MTQELGGPKFEFHKRVTLCDNYLKRPFLSSWPFKVWHSWQINLWVHGILLLSLLFLDHTQISSVINFKGDITLSSNPDVFSLL